MTKVSGYVKPKAVMVPLPETDLIANYKATEDHQAAVGEPQLWVKGDIVSKIAKFEGGVWVDEYVNMSKIPNVPIPEGVFQISSFLLEGEKAVVAKKRIGYLACKITATPRTLKQIFEENGQTYPEGVGFVEVVVDGDALQGGDNKVRYSVDSVTVATDGEPFNTDVSFDTQEDINELLYVADTEVVDGEIKVFIRLYNVPN
jgi:hypothetical protein